MFFSCPLRTEKPTEQGAVEVVPTANTDEEALSSACSNTTEDIQPEGK